MACSLGLFQAGEREMEKEKERERIRYMERVLEAERRTKNEKKRGMKSNLNGWQWVNCI